MKHLSKNTFAIIAASLVFVSFVFASCEKENANLTPQEQVSLKAAPGMGPNDTIYYPGNTSEHWSDKKGKCIKGGHGCLTPVVITPDVYSRITIIAAAIKENPLAAPYLFQENKVLLEKVLDDIFISSVIENNVSVTIQEECQENPYTYFIFHGNFHNSDIYVVPVCH